MAERTGGTAMLLLGVVLICAVTLASGWAAWKFFQRDYFRARQIGGKEWLEVERITKLAVISAAFIGGLLTMAGVILIGG